ncbi:hypothetical protein C8R46DRAFT_1361929 [Mycena filopes]|nr:hypothetical protein C8R46DRAFT_1361929 [Mycena filopes]
MQHNNNPSYYREHTRQQDGWTVLAPPPQPEADLPPPYTPEAPPSATATPGPASDGTTLTFEIPINSNIVGATPVTRTKNYGIAVPFAVGYGEICRMMGLEVTTACIGYKWDNERANAATHSLANATDWKNCLESGIGQTKRARVRRVTCMIKNLNLPAEAAGGLSTGSTAVTTNNKKRKAPASPDGGKKTFEFTKQFRELKTHLDCATHKGQRCWVSPTDGHHHPVDPEHTTLWAKEISVGHATINRPPENIMFQDFFLPAPKRLRTGRPEPATNPYATPPLPAIHVTVNTAPLPRLRPHGPIWTTLLPPAPVTQYPAVTASGSENNDFGFDVRYPSVTEVLQQIDDSGEFVDSIPFPTIIFADTLADSQITRVDHVPVFDTDYFVREINMPVVLAKIFVEQSIIEMGRAEKGKGKE